LAYTSRTPAFQHTCGLLAKDLLLDVAARDLPVNEAGDDSSPPG
jgi:hypothetical protein